MKLQANEAVRGFSLLEIIIVIAIIVLVATIIVIPFSQFRNRQTLDGAAEEFSSLIALARAKTMSSEGNARYGIHFTSSSASLFQGASFPGDNESANIVVNLSALVSISYTLAGGGADMIFQRLTGDTTQSGTIIISLVADNTQQRVLTVETTGNVSMP